MYLSENTDLINGNEVHTGLLRHSIALDDAQQTSHFIVDEQMFSTSYAVLRIRRPPQNHAVLKHSFVLYNFSPILFYYFFSCF